MATIAAFLQLFSVSKVDFELPMPLLPANLKIRQTSYAEWLQRTCRAASSCRTIEFDHITNAKGVLQIDDSLAQTGDDVDGFGDRNLSMGEPDGYKLCGHELFPARSGMDPIVRGSRELQYAGPCGADGRRRLCRAQRPHEPYLRPHQTACDQNGCKRRHRVGNRLFRRSLRHRSVSRVRHSTDPGRRIYHWCCPR